MTADCHAATTGNATLWKKSFPSVRPAVAVLRPEAGQPLVLTLGNPVSDAMCDPSEFELLFFGVPAPPPRGHHRRASSAG